MTTTTRIPAGTLSDGRTVNRFVLANDRLEVSLLALGARAIAVKLKGVSQNLVLEYPSIADYEQDQLSMGAVVGRYANRIRGGSFPLDGRRIQLTVNRDSYHLHGGSMGFARRLWQGENIADGARFSLHSESGDEGYPGNLDVMLDVRLAGDVLEYHYQAVADQDTIVNLTNHSYFNLDASPDIRNHRLQLLADHYLPIDEDSLPTGELRSVTGSPFDFRTIKPIGRNIDMDHPQLRLGAGYDHCFALRSRAREPGQEPALAARLIGRIARLAVFTTEPGIQLYTGNYLPQARQGVCLETQHFPDSPNQPRFPSTRLRAGQTYSSITRYQFEPTS